MVTVLDYDEIALDIKIVLGASRPSHGLLLDSLVSRNSSHTRMDSHLGTDQQTDTNIFLILML